MKAPQFAGEGETENETSGSKSFCNDGLDTVANLGWMGDKGTHFHCKECGQLVNFVTGLKWKAGIGVRRLGICEECELMLIQSEHKKIRWIKI